MHLGLLALPAPPSVLLKEELAVRSPARSGCSCLTRRIRATEACAEFE